MRRLAFPEVDGDALPSAVAGTGEPGGVIFASQRSRQPETLRKRRQRVGEIFDRRVVGEPREIPRRGEFAVDGADHRHRLGMTGARRQVHMRRIDDPDR